MITDNLIAAVIVISALAFVTARLYRWLKQVSSGKVCCGNDRQCLGTKQAAAKSRSTSATD